MAVEVCGFKITDNSLFSLDLVREIIAELFGTFLLVLTVGLTVADANGSSDKVVHISLAVGLGIGGIVHLFSDISGGQLNPAVSFALFFGRVISLYKAVVFTVVQIVGGIIGAAVVRGVMGENYGVVAKAGSITTSQAFFLEFIGTLFLVLTVLASVNGKRGHSPGYLQPLAIGISIAVAHFYLVPKTGAGINPARSMATNIVANEFGDAFWLYIVGPMVAAFVGGIFYEFVFSSYYDNDETYNKAVRNGAEA